jgi:hypothetical protein
MFASLAMCAAAEAAEAPAAAPPPSAATPPASAASAPSTPTRAYSADQMYRFAHATVELQLLREQDPASMSRVIQDAGMRVEDYNEMGDAMRADPALASSLNPYLEDYNAERAQRLMAQRSNYVDSAPARSRHHAKARARTTHHAHATAHSASRTHKASHKAKAGRHAATGHAHHTALKPASHHHHHRT